MNDQARAIKILAIITTLLVIICFVITYLLVKTSTIFPYIALSISILACLSLWWQYFKAKKKK